MEVAARVEGLRQYLIHGEPYTQVYFSHLDDPDTIRQARLSADALSDDLRVGDEVTVLYLVNVVASIRRANP